jgi:hypothetical protein
LGVLRIPAERRECMTKSLKSLSCAAAVIVIFLTATPGSVLSQAVQLVVVDVNVVARGYRASKLAGSDVQNDRNEKIGTIDDIIIGRDRALFAVLQIGGFLGLGGQLVAVPFESLQLDEPGGKIVLPGASKDELKKLTPFKYLGT